MANFKMPADQDDFAPGTEDRIQAALATAGALCNPEDAIEDWGHFDEDYTEEQIQKDREFIGEAPKKEDVHCSTIEEINRFYKSTQLLKISIKTGQTK